MGWVSVVRLHAGTAAVASEKPSIDKSSARDVPVAKMRQKIAFARSRFDWPPKIMMGLSARTQRHAALTRRRKSELDSPGENASAFALLKAVGTTLPGELTPEDAIPAQGGLRENGLGRAIMARSRH